ncbi:MAG: response regulator transcription factor [Planctomycetota bacterium]|nr:MAG: response regulator transcription factor [Planctomycetota bacterium]
MSPREARVLVVEDEARIARLLCDNLEAEGYRVMHAADGEAGLRAARDGGIDLILLDVMLPRLDGFEVCRRLRAEGNRAPVLFLTARDLPPDRVRGLQAGGDDYLVKPFHLAELLARVAALLRRAAWSAEPAGGRVRVGAGWADLVTREAESVDGAKDTLPAKEFGILQLLIEARGAIVSRSRILDRVWGGEADPTPRTVDNFVVRLRRRFEPDPENPRYILTIRGTGYRLVPADRS